jgi:octaprenyl-diphosphate synthase
MNTQYTQRLERIEAVLNTWLPETPDSAWIERIFGADIGKGAVSRELAASLARPGWDLVNRGGKRWRPLLMLLTAESVAGECGGAAALPLTPLVEFPHNASLIHDDIEDNSDERRGKPAVHLLYGMDTAINSGSFMYFLPLACLDSGAKNPALRELIWTAWASHMRGLHLGQAMDITWHREHSSLPGLDEYDQMCRLKTGCLARLAAILGVYCGAFATADSAANAADGAKLRALADVFGGAAEQLGVGFQILDDVKNLDTGVPGKKRGDDIVEGKKSLPVLLYLHKYPEKRDFAARCFAAAGSNGVKAPEVEEFIAALSEAGVLEEARAKAFEYIEDSRRVFSTHEAAGFALKEDGRELLAGLADLLG